MPKTRSVGPDAATLAELDARLARLFDDAYFTKLKESIDRGQVPAPIELFFLSHRFGKPAETHQVTGHLTLEQIITNSRK
jgi:hypothetical protein